MPPNWTFPDIGTVRDIAIHGKQSRDCASVTRGTSSDDAPGDPDAGSKTHQTGLRARRK